LSDRLLLESNLLAPPVAAIAAIAAIAAPATPSVVWVAIAESVTVQPSLVNDWVVDQDLADERDGRRADSDRMVVGDGGEQLDDALVALRVEDTEAVAVEVLAEVQVEAEVAEERAKVGRVVERARVQEVAEAGEVHVLVEGRVQSLDAEHVVLVFAEDSEVGER